MGLRSHNSGLVHSGCPAGLLDPEHAEAGHEPVRLGAGTEEEECFLLTWSQHLAHCLAAHSALLKDSDRWARFNAESQTVGYTDIWLCLMLSFKTLKLRISYCKGTLLCLILLKLLKFVDHTNTVSAVRF